MTRMSDLASKAISLNSQGLVEIRVDQGGLVHDDDFLHTKSGRSGLADHFLDWFVLGDELHSVMSRAALVVEVNDFLHLDCGVA